MNWYRTTLTFRNRTIERGWMLAETDAELIDYARIMGYGIDIAYLGEADMQAVTPEIKTAAGDRTARSGAICRV